MNNHNSEDNVKLTFSSKLGVALVLLMSTVGMIKLYLDGASLNVLYWSFFGYVMLNFIHYTIQYNLIKNRSNLKKTDSKVESLEEDLKTLIDAELEGREIPTKELLKMKEKIEEKKNS